VSETVDQILDASVEPKLRESGDLEALWLPTQYPRTNLALDPGVEFTERDMGLAKYLHLAPRRQTSGC
jgi:hypothetical protein